MGVRQGLEGVPPREGILSIRPGPTGGEWRRFSTTFTAPEDRTAITLEIRGQDEGERTWLDEAELVTICEP